MRQDQGYVYVDEISYEFHVPLFPKCREDYMADQITALRTQLERLCVELQHFAQAAPPSGPLPSFAITADTDSLSLIITDNHGGDEANPHPMEQRLTVSFCGGRISDVDHADLPGPRFAPGAEDPVGALASVIRCLAERRLGLLHAGNAPELVFCCPFCHAIAEEATPQRTLCASRICACGALGLSSPMVDQDELIDDAIQVLGVEIPIQARGSDAALLEAIRAAGYTIRDGWSGGSDRHPWGPQTTMWFRRS